MAEILITNTIIENSHLHMLHLQGMSCHVPMQVLQLFRALGATRLDMTRQGVPQGRSISRERAQENLVGIMLDLTVDPIDAHHPNVGA